MDREHLPRLFQDGGTWWREVSSEDDLVETTYLSTKIRIDYTTLDVQSERRLSFEETHAWAGSLLGQPASG